jgi:glycosyltransferase involved in cell wall biosynthesis
MTTATATANCNRRMKVLVAHNFYQQPGGEDQVFRSELALLASRGHEPVRFEMHNDDVRGMGTLALLSATVWHRAAADRVRELVRAHKADIVHFHNTFPLMSPAVYSAARAEGAAVVQTLHNFRLLCPGANLYRDGGVCEDCVGRSIPLGGVIHKCYRGDRSASFATAAMLTIHRGLGTWRDCVDAYITPTRFAREKFIAGGLPAEKIHVKPNFVDPDPGFAEGGGAGGYAIFVGRLSKEKGVDTLLAAWSHLASTVPLKIVGDGPLAEEVRPAVGRDRAIEWLGHRHTDEVLKLIADAAVLVMPSNCYETFGRVLIEAFAKGTPVIASDHGAPADVVDHGRTGLRFKPGDGADLAAKVRELLGDEPARRRMRLEVRREYEAKYTGAANYDMLMNVYQFARERRPCPDKASRETGVSPPVPVPRG